MTELRAITGGKPDVKALPFAERLLLLYERMGYMQKGGNNKAMGYSFLQEAAVKERFNQCCRDLGIIVAEVDMTMSADTTPQSAVVKVRIRLADMNMGPDNPRLAIVEWTGLGSDQDKTGKAVMKAEAAAYKYAVTSGCMVSTGDDPEASAAGDRFQEEEKLEDLRARIAAAMDLNTANHLKNEVRELSASPAFKGLKAALKARIEVLTTLGDPDKDDGGAGASPAGNEADKENA